MNRQDVHERWIVGRERCGWIKLETPTNLPVDIEHVLAAIVLAARKGELDPNTPLSADDPALAGVLAGHVKTVFADYGGEVGEDD